MIKNLRAQKIFKNINKYAIAGITMLLLLTGIVQQGKAQIYYVINDGDGTKLTANDAFGKINANGTNKTTLSGSIANSPIHMALDLANNRAFVYDGYSQVPPNGLSIKVVNLTTGATINTITYSEASRVIAMKYDPIEDYLYFTLSDLKVASNTSNVLYRIKPDGTGKTIILDNKDLAIAGPIALDIRNKRVFVLNNVFGSRSILTLNLETKAIEKNLILASNPVSGVSMDYDAENDFLYLLTSDNKAYTNSEWDGMYKFRPNGTSLTAIAKSIGAEPTTAGFDFPHKTGYFFIHGTVRTLYKIDLVSNEIAAVTDFKDMTVTSAQIFGINLPNRPLVSTAAATNVSSTSSTLNGTIVKSDLTLTERGIVYSSTTNLPVIGGTGVVKAVASGTGITAFNIAVSGLSASTFYYARAYATSSAGTSYGDLIPFITLSNNANLSGLTFNNGTLNPVFSAEQTAYALNVANSITSITLTPLKAQSNATITVNGTAVNSSTASGNIALKIGENAIAVKVLAEDGTTTKTYTINAIRAKTPQTITFNEFETKIYGDANFTPQGSSASSGLPITWRSSNPGIATVDANGNISIKSAGKVNIVAKQNGNADYLAADSVIRTLTVKKVPLTYIANNATKVYGATNPVFTGTLTGFINGDTQVSATTGTMVFAAAVSENAGAGVYELTGNGLTSSNYSFVQAASNIKAFTITKATLTYKAIPAVRKYGMSDPVFSGTVTGFAYSDNVQNATSGILSFNTTATVKSLPGNYVINGSGLKASNYEFAQDSQNAVAFAIGKTDLIITASPATRQYGAANPSFTGMISGLVNDETLASLNGTLVYETNATLTTPTGSYNIIASGLTSDKYNIINAAGNATALTITRATLYYIANAISHPRNSPIPTLAGTLTGFMGADNIGNATSGTLEFTTTAQSGSEVGNYPVTGSGVTATNYNIVQHPANATAFTVLLSDNGTLSSIQLIDGDPIELDGGFSPGKNNYTVSINNLTTSIAIVSYLNDNNARLTVNGTPVNSGQAASIPLNVGPNTVHINVTAENGTTTNPYTVVVTRLPSKNANLSSFNVSVGTPVANESLQNNYTVIVGPDVSAINLSAIAEDPNAKIYIAGTALNGSSGALDLQLQYGENYYVIAVQAQDGVTYKYYQFTVKRERSINNKLASLNVAEGSIGTFDNDTQVYNLNIDNLQTSVNITAVTEDSKAAVIVDGYNTYGQTLNLPTRLGIDTVTVNVFAQSYAVRTFKIIINRPLSNDATLRRIDIPGNRFDVPFEAGTFNYVDTISYNTGVYRLSAFASHEGATVTINTIPIDGYSGILITPQYFSAKETATIVVTAQDGVTTKTYTVDVIREFSNNALLAELGFSNLSLQLDQPFDPALNNYTMSVGADVGYVNVHVRTQTVNTETRVAYGRVLSNAPTPGGDYGFVELHGGTNIIPISVFSYGGATNIYMLTIYREYTDNANLAALSITSTGSFNKFLNSSSSPALSDNMTVNIPYTTPAIYISPIPSDVGGTVANINGELVTADQRTQLIPLVPGDNVINITVTSGDGTTSKNYTLHANRLPFADVSLSALGLSKGEISPAFSPEVLTYDVKVGSTDTKFTVTPVATDPAAAVTIGSNTINVANPSVEITIQNTPTPQNTNIRVTGTDGITTATYRLRVTKAAANANLTNIILNHGTLNFDRNETVYNTAVPFTNPSVTITPLTLESDAAININGTVVNSSNPSVTIPLTVGSNLGRITVTSANGVITKEYLVYVERLPAETDATLSYLGIDGKQLNQTFDPDLTIYSASSLIDSDTIAMHTIAADLAGAKITVNGITPDEHGYTMVPLMVGTNKVSIVVTAESGVKKTYKVVLTRVGISSNANLASVILNQGTLRPFFKSTKTDYTATVSYDTEEIVITPTPADLKSVVKVNGINIDQSIGVATLPLEVGINNISILVKAQDSVTFKTYNFTITRVADANAPTLTFSLNPASTLVKAAGLATHNYTASVASETESITITPLASDPTGIITIGGNVVISGTSSGQILLADTVTVINMDITSARGSKRTYSVAVKKAGSSVASMTFKVSPASTLVKTTGNSRYNYSTSVAPGTESIKITPASTDPLAVVRIGTEIVANGTESRPIMLSDGINIIEMEVTAPSGLKWTYTLAVSREGSSVASMTFKVTPASTLVKTTGSSRYNYTTSVAAGTGSITITPTPTDPLAVVRIGTQVIANGTASQPIMLTDSVTIVDMEVTAQSGLKWVYTLAVRREGSSVASMTFKVTPASTLVKTTGSSRYNYTTSVAAGTGSITITPTPTDPLAVVRIGTQVIANGTASQPIMLTDSVTVVDMEVTAQSGLKWIYTLAVSREGSSVASMTFKVTPASTLVKTTGNSRYNYTTSVAAGTESITITPTPTDPLAVVRIGTQVIANGTASQPILLTDSLTTIDMEVTAQSGLKWIYTLAVSHNRVALKTMLTMSNAVTSDRKSNTATIEKTTISVVQGISPNGDGYNDELVIDGLSAYPDNTLIVINGAGEQIYKTTAYGAHGNVFDGHDSKGLLQKPGTYYYLLDYSDKGKMKRKRGFFTINY